MPACQPGNWSQSTSINSAQKYCNTLEMNSHRDSTKECAFQRDNNEGVVMKRGAENPQVVQSSGFSVNNNKAKEINTLVSQCECKLKHLAFSSDNHLSQYLSRMGTMIFHLITEDAFKMQISKIA